MKKSKLYTGTGDAGTTSLCGGERIAKDDVRLDAYGTIDEFSSFLGVLIADPGCTSEIKEGLTAVQNRLFDIGSYLASDPDSKVFRAEHGLTDQDIAALESWIDRADAQTPPIKAFVLPGGCMAAAHAHVCRAVCRRAERRILALSRTAQVDPLVTRYFNRLSDLLFILARQLNHLNGIAEIVWQQHNS